METNVREPFEIGDLFYCKVFGYYMVMSILTGRGYVCMYTNVLCSYIFHDTEIRPEFYIGKGD